ncbi:hypothetical protein F5876DRAFT_76645 [Lentinula aff. lateritia]|uniref:Uncharacterized protein n=1 Tax=Lentinula aff. lateritia TaxID=2804960 RepID=A0ACC1U0L9_9AGAR|nr:hypothetical protein F5876DRAFT_76645 [Lentinula aff. lateritia]
MASSASSAVARIRESVEDFSFTSGTCKIPRDSAISTSKGNWKARMWTQMFHVSKTLLPKFSEAKFLDTANATKEQLASSQALNLLQFATPFDLASTIILHSIQQDLALRRMIRAEPYMLNVYDEGSFFKPHRDTPRGPNMFGSLVIIFPTTHEGGELILT